MHARRSRPLSPHLTIWRWGPHMLVSILHRATGAALSLVGGAVLVWWLLALAGGPDSYRLFSVWSRQGLGIAVGLGLTWAFFQHLLSGLRHLVMDAGAGLELRTNRVWARMTLAGSALLTTALWLHILFGRNT
jgi:succinate dehydrogenase / fumarate reductase, cytochrome b subunit